MKKLQLFAEPTDPNPIDPTPPVDPKDPKEPTDPKPEPKYTDEDLDRIIGDRLARWQKEQDKKISEAEKLAKMDAQEKAEYEKKQLEKELQALKDKETLSEMSKQARKMLSESNINISDDLLAVLVSTDAEATKNAVEAFKVMYSDAVKKGIAEALKGEPPKAGNSGTAITKEEILAVKDRKERQRLITENIELFK